MNVKGLYNDKDWAEVGAAKIRNFSNFAPALNKDGTIVFNDQGGPALKRHRRRSN